MDNEDYILTHHYEVENGSTKMLDGNKSWWPAILAAITVFLVIVSTLATWGVLQSTGGPYTMLYAFVLPSFGAGVGAAASFMGFTERRWVYLAVSVLALAFFIINSPWFAIVALFVWIVFIVS